ncbi:unnamed protein product [Effrenium voratum]|nr:unnamed protein product [Effrenium voratum]
MRSACRTLSAPSSWSPARSCAESGAERSAPSPGRGSGGRGRRSISELSLLARMTPENLKLRGLGLPWRASGKRRGRRRRRRPLPRRHRRRGPEDLPDPNARAEPPKLEGPPVPPVPAVPRARLCRAGAGGLPLPEPGFR